MLRIRKCTRRVDAWNSYASMKDAKEHGETQWFKDFFNTATSQNLLSKEVAPQIMYSKSVSGFDLDHKFIQ